jgi:hypothetical protein
MSSHRTIYFLSRSKLRKKIDRVFQFCVASSLLAKACCLIVSCLERASLQDMHKINTIVLEYSSTRVLEYLLASLANYSTTGTLRIDWHALSSSFSSYRVRFFRSKQASRHTSTTISYYSSTQLLAS